MTTSDDELEDFKTRIALPDYAAAEGFAIDRKSTCRNSIAMKHPAGEKIVIGMASDGHWIYFSVHDAQNHGSIIDLVQHLHGCDLGEARKMLRPFLPDGGAAPGRPAGHGPPAPTTRLEPVTKDLLNVRAKLAAMMPIEHDHSYLTRTRKIPAALLASDRFAGCILTDDRGNAIFPHWNINGDLCGFEIKNASFSGFSPGGTKGVFFGGRKTEGDTHLAVSESAIDALSYYSLQGNNHLQVISTAGAMNPDQPALLRIAIEHMPAGSEIIAATDNDEGGDKLADQIEAAFTATERTDITFRRHSPPTAGQDWNNVLAASVSRPDPSPGPV